MKKVKLTSVCRPKQWKSIPISELSDVGYPVYGANGVIGYYDSYNHEQETVIITCRGATCGTVNLTHPRSYVTGNAMCLDNVKDSVDIKYLFYSMQAYDFTKVISGTAQPQITRVGLEKVEITLPSLDVQREIVSILDKINALIEQRRLQLKKLEELVKARFVEMFGHQSHNEKSLPYMTIDDVAEIYLGITHTPTYVDSGVIFISSKNTSGDFLDLSDVKYISREEFEGAPKGSKPKANDVLFSRVGSNLGHPVILEEELELCTFVSLGFLRSKGTVTSNYLKHWMRDEFFARQVSEHVKGGGQPNLNTGWLKEFKIIVPDMDQQKKFDAFCCQIDKSKATVQKALDETQLLFDSLMQKYFG